MAEQGHGTGMACCAVQSYSAPMHCSVHACCCSLVSPALPAAANQNQLLRLPSCAAPISLPGGRTGRGHCDGA